MNKSISNTSGTTKNTKDSTLSDQSISSEAALAYCKPTESTPPVSKTMMNVADINNNEDDEEEEGEGGGLVEVDDLFPVAASRY